MATAVTITEAEMREFLEHRGFQQLKNMVGPNGRPVRELVLGLRVSLPGSNFPLSLRVYTSIEGGVSRSNGQDAIRVVLFKWVDGTPKIVGSDRRVHRVAGWKGNLAERLASWMELIGPNCPRCGEMMVRRTSPKGDFWGCCRYPDCRGSRRIDDVGPVPNAVVPVQNVAPVQSADTLDSFFDGLIDQD